MKKKIMVRTMQVIISLFLINHYTSPIYGMPEEGVYDEYATVSSESAEGHEGKYLDDSREPDVSNTEMPLEAHKVTSKISSTSEGSTIDKQDIKPVKNSDEYLLAGVIMGEACGEDEQQKLYVGSVVLNRVADDRFPDSIYEVLTQKGQYMSVRQNGSFKTEPDAASYAAARRLLREGSILPAKVVWQANFSQGKVYLRYGSLYYGY